MKAGFSKKQTHHFEDAEEAERGLDPRSLKGDMVLFKGSQSARRERVPKDLMAEPLHAKELLVRQGEYWMNN